MSIDYKAIGKAFNSLVNNGLSEDVVLKRLKIDDLTGVVAKLKSLDDDSLETVLDLFGLDINNFSVESKPDNKPTTKPETKSKPIPKIFTKQNQSRPTFINITELTEHLIKLLPNLVNLPEGYSSEFDLNFLHLSKKAGCKDSVKINGISCDRQFYVTKESQPKTNCNLLQNYDEDYSEKAWSKLYQSLGHIAELYALSKYLECAVKHFLSLCDTDLNAEDSKKFLTTIAKAVKSNFNSWDQEEQNWLLINHFELLYKFSKYKHAKGNTNLEQTYGTVDFIGGNSTTESTPKAVSKEFVTNLLETKSTQPTNDQQSKPVNKPTKPEQKPFVIPEGSDTVIDILQAYGKIDNDFSLDSQLKLDGIKIQAKKLISDLTLANVKAGSATKKLNCEYIDTLEQYLSANK